MSEEQGIDRRTFLRRTGITAAGLQFVSLPALLAACSSSGGTKASTDNSTATSSAKGNLTLKMPFLLDMQVPDPDIMYEGEGLQVMLACYEGLVNYKPGTGTIVPGLADSWTVSTDLLTYTFKLKPGVKFHDGTAADATAWQKSFERRKTVNQGPEYMVDGVVKMETPDPLTFIVTLKEPNDAFLDYLACPWQPYAVSPTAVAKYASGNDVAQGWLKTHDAGTGAYVISEFVPGSHYTLEAFPDYWGPKPQFTTVRIDIIPDVATQRLKLESGDLDLVTKGFATEDVKQFQKNSKYKVIVTESTSIIALWLNATGDGVFKDKAVRKAMLQAIDRDKIITPTYQGLAKIEKNYYSENMFPDGKAPFDLAYDPSILKGMIKDLPTKKIDLAYAESGGAPYRRMAELIQTQLAAIGLDVAVRGMPTSQVFGLATGAAKQRPDLLLWSYGGDALHVDTVLRIFLRTGAAPLNWDNYSNKDLDTKMDKAITEPTKDMVEADYVSIAKDIQDEAWFIPFARRPEVIIARAGLSGFESNSYLPSILNLDVLKSS